MAKIIQAVYVDGHILDLGTEISDEMALRLGKRYVDVLPVVKVQEVVEVKQVVVAKNKQVVKASNKSMKR